MVLLCCMKAPITFILKAPSSEITSPLLARLPTASTVRPQELVVMPHGTQKRSRDPNNGSGEEDANIRPFQATKSKKGLLVAPPGLREKRR